jgi:Flp pilus assembly protein TadD
LSLDPLFANAYAHKARLYDASLSFDPIPANDWEDYLADLVRVIRENAERAIELNPDLSLPYFALSDIYAKELRASDARINMNRAVDLAPNDPNILMERAWLDLYAQDVAAATALAERAVELSPEQRGRLGLVYLFAGDLERAMQESRYAQVLDPNDGFNYLQIAAIELRRGNDSEAREALAVGEELISETQYLISQLAFLYALAGDATAAQRAFDRLAAYSERFHVDDLGWVLASLAVGDREEALRRLRAEVESGFVDGSSTHRALVRSNIWDAPVLNEPDFVQLRSMLGLD